MKCHEMQGYYYSPPISSHEATVLLSRHMRGFEHVGNLAAG